MKGVSEILLAIGFIGLKSRPFCLDLGHFAKIWAILVGFGLFGRIWVRIGPKGDEALRMGGTDGRTDGQTDGRMDGRTDGQIPPVFCRTSSPSESLPCSPSA